MSTFLDLAQRVAQDSGTIPTLGDPSSVTGQTGRLARIVSWTRDAWEDIQNLEEDWRWLQHTFSGQTITGNPRLNAANLGITERFAAWRGECDWVIYPTETGRSGQGRLGFMPWDQFYPMYAQVAENLGAPQVFSITPQNEVYLYPTPNKRFTISGQYQKSNQTLNQDSDTPECPARFHDAIKWKALVHLGTFDEAMVQVGIWDRNYLERISQLRDDQLPRVRIDRSDF